jgi:hypothetical protein
LLRQSSTKRRMPLREAPSPVSFAEIAAARHDWAWEARRKHLSSLGIAVRDTGEGAPRPLVSLYGQSQVGKTGLVLRLMGLSNNNLNRANKVLRGKQKPGKPATVTAQVYSRNDKPEWTLRAEGKPDVVCKSDVEFEGILRKLRDDVHTGAFDSTDKLHIGLPSDLFTTDVEDLPQVVDLPGVNSSELKEKPHVKRLIDTFISLSSNVLVVVNSANLASIKRSSIAGESDWHMYDEKFQIVFTFSLSESSVKEAILGDSGTSILKVKSLQDLYSYYQHHLQESGISSKFQFYCLEFGLSWEKFNPIAKELTQPWIDSEVLRLRDNLNSSSSPLSMFSNFNFEKRRNESLYLKQLAILKAEICAYNSEIAETGSKLSELKEDLDEYDKVLHEWDTALRARSIPSGWPRLSVSFKKPESKSLKEITRAVGESIDSLKNQLKSQLVEAIPGEDYLNDGLRRMIINIKSKNVIIRALENVHKNSVNGLGPILGGNRYFYSPKFESDCEEAKRRLKAGLQDVKDLMKGIVRDTIHNANQEDEKKKHSLDDRIRTKKKRLVHFQDSMNGLTRRLKEATCNARFLTRDFKLRQNKIQVDSDFTGQLNAAFHERVKGLVSEYSAPTISPLERHESLLKLALTLVVKSQLDHM